MIRISAVVCTHNRARLLEGALRSLVEQTLPPEEYEVLVVDNASHDDTPASFERVAAGRNNLRYVLEPRLGLSRARNRGVAEARGEVVAFIDDDAEATPDWLEALLAVFERESRRPLCVGGRVSPVWQAPRPGWLPGSAYEALTIVDDGEESEGRDHIVGCNVAFERTFLAESGGFDPLLGRKGESLVGNEEVAVLRRLVASGGAVVYEPRARVMHLIPAERLRLRWMLRRYYAQGVSDALLAHIWGSRRQRMSRLGRDVKQFLRSPRAFLAQPKSQIGFTLITDFAYEAGKAIERLRGLRSHRAGEARAEATTSDAPQADDASPPG